MKRALSVLSLIVGFSRVFAGVEFAGYMTLDDKVQVVLFDAEADKPSGWLTIGQTFSGHTVRSFDAETEVLTVDRQGKTLQLSVRQAKVSAASVARATLEDGLRSRRSELLRLQLRYTERHPRVIKARADIARLERQLSGL